MGFWKESVFTKDNGLHAAAGLAISGFLVPATLATPWGAPGAVAVLLCLGWLREQTQKAIKDDLDGLQAWTALFHDPHRLMEGLAWPVGALVLHLPLVFL